MNRAERRRLQRGKGTRKGDGARRKTPSNFKSHTAVPLGAGPIKVYVAVPNELVFKVTDGWFRPVEVEER